LAAYEDVTDEKSEEESDKRLPPMKIGQDINATKYSCEGHETKPPARYTEPTLVKKLEELGIGRPSTFASIIQTIQDRGYVVKRVALLCRHSSHFQSQAFSNSTFRS